MNLTTTAGRRLRSHAIQGAIAVLAIACIFAAFSTARSQAQETVDARLLESQAMKAAVANVAPSVVRIETFGGLERVNGQVLTTGPTTGLVVGTDGYVLSSAFNFVQQPTSILVTLPSGKRASAQIVARDSSRMLVLLKVNTDESLAVPAFVPKEEMVVGQWTIAVGRTFDPQHPNMSVGILSAPGRIWGKAIQTDAKISPSNYGGPLIDIRGRVLGLLVPMSPQQNQAAQQARREGQLVELAGNEWYDSGIGFAVPLVDLLPRLDEMKEGQSLSAGVIGIRLKGDDEFSDPAEIAVCQIGTPAYEAGLRAGDTIVEAEGVAIVRQAQLKHVLGPKYAGDTVHVIVKRGDEQLEFDVTLVDQIDPFEHPFLGVLPMRDARPDGSIAVRYVFPGSPAAEAGLEAGDVVTAFDGEQLADREALLAKLATHGRDKPMTLTVQRGDETMPIELKMTTLTGSVPDELPAAREEMPEAPAEQPVTGVVEIKIPEEQNECIAYVPANYHPDVEHGLIVWLHSSGGYDRDKLVARWKEHCERDGLILLAPRSADPARWSPTEVDFTRKTIEDVMSRYRVDRSRVVVHGYQSGAAIGYLLGFSQTELVRGLAVVDAALPRRARVPDNDPLNRLMIYSVAPAESKVSETIQEGLDRLRELKFPVEQKTFDGPSRELNEEELAELLRWVDSLDRL